MNDAITAPRYASRSCRTDVTATSREGRLLDGLLDELMADRPAVLLVGPRAAGKTTTALQRAASVIRLDVPGEALAFRADPDAIMRGASEPVLLDEWRAGIDRPTAASYERVLENVFVVEALPAWRTNQLKRLAFAPRRYVMDAGLMAAILRTDMQAILHDGKLLGRVIDTFVTQQLRGELEVSPARQRLYHLRDQDGRREVDIVAELGGERVLGFEISFSFPALGWHDRRADGQ